MAKYTYSYANGRGRGEFIRLLFAAAGQEFTDHRIDLADWPAIKPNAPFGQIPFLEVTEGDKTVKVAQSLAIAKFLGKRFGLAGKDEYDQVFADMYANQIMDVHNDHIYFYWHEKDEAKKKELEDKYNNETVPKNLAFFEKRLSENKGHFAGDGLTYADLYLFAWLEILGDKQDSVLEKYPAIKALVNEIKNEPKIAAYLAKRPASFF